jgi:hypothetical protein
MIPAILALIRARRTTMGSKARPHGKRHTIEGRVDFLNVDLELEGASDLDALVEALGDVFVLHRTTEPPFVANLEMEPAVGMDFDATLSALLDRVEKLDERARRLWEQCTARRFDVGIQSGLEPHSSQYVLSVPLLQRLTAVGADVVVTVYGARYETTT